MGETKLYSAHDIKNLKQKIATYKDTLTILKTGDSTENYLSMREEFNGFKAQLTDLEELMEIMDEEQSMQFGEYKQEVKSFSTQVDTLNRTVEELNQKVSSIMNQMRGSNRNNLVETKPLIGLQGFSNARVNDNIKETSRRKEQFSIPSIPKSNLPPSYKQFQSIVNNSKSIEELPAGLTPMETFDFQKNVQEEQYNFSKRNTPLKNMNLGQLNNNLHKNNPPKLAGAMNRQIPTKRISIKCVDTQSIPILETIPANTDTVKEPLNIEPNVLTKEKVEEQNEPLKKKLENTIQVKENIKPGKEEAIQKREDIIEEKENTRQKKEDVIENSSNLKRREGKNKDPLAIFKFFWK